MASTILLSLLYIIPQEEIHLAHITREIYTLHTLLVALLPFLVRIIVKICIVHYYIFMVYIYITCDLPDSIYFSLCLYINDKWL